MQASRFLYHMLQRSVYEEIHVLPSEMRGKIQDYKLYEGNVSLVHIQTSEANFEQKGQKIDTNLGE